MQLANYTTSKDYEYLAELMLEYSIVCIIRKDSKGFEFKTPRFANTSADKSTTQQGVTIYEVMNMGLGWIYAWGKEDFIKQCQEYDLSFIVPNE